MQIVLIEGDGIGPEVTQAACRVVAAAGVKIDWVKAPAGLPAAEQFGEPLPEETLEMIRRYRVALKGPIFLGHIVHHLVPDPREPGVLLMSASTGHLGPTIYRSEDGGETWAEATQPPAFPKSDHPKARAVAYSFWLEPGHAAEPGVWWAGASPPGLFQSRDGGRSWESVRGFNEHPMYEKWCPAEWGTPDGPLLNQVVIDPRETVKLVPLRMVIWP